MKNRVLSQWLIFVGIILIFMFLIISIYLILNTTYLQREFNINPKNFIVIDKNDTHGGFHGDGTYHIALDCSKKKEKVLKIVNEWSELPLSENLQLIMYGGEKDGMTYGYNIAKETNIPIIANGYYCFLDRHSDTVDKYSDIDLFDRYSYNFSLAIYDTDTDILYYIRQDT